MLAVITVTSLVDNLFVAGTPTTLMYRSDRVRERSPFFPAGTPHEDTEVFYEILLEHDLGFVHEVLTFTRRENESLTTSLMTIDPEHRLDKLVVTMKYGPACLDEEEFRTCRNRDEGAYYAFLGRRCLYRTDAAFWAHHQRGLRRAGVDFRRSRFVPALVRAALMELTHPAHLMQRLGRLVSGIVGSDRDSARSRAPARSRAGERGSGEIR